MYFKVSVCAFKLETLKYGGESPVFFVTPAGRCFYAVLMEETKEVLSQPPKKRNKAYTGPQKNVVLKLAASLTAWHRRTSVSLQVRFKSRTGENIFIFLWRSQLYNCELVPTPSFFPSAAIPTRQKIRGRGRATVLAPFLRPTCTHV